MDAGRKKLIGLIVLLLLAFCLTLAVLERQRDSDPSYDPAARTERMVEMMTKQRQSEADQRHSEEKLELSRRITDEIVRSRLGRDDPHVKSLEREFAEKKQQHELELADRKRREELEVLRRIERNTRK